MDKNEPQTEGNWRVETNTVIANNLLEKVKELLNAEVNSYNCYDSNNPTFRYKKIVIEYGKEKN
tara:strand:- start:1806 stop:1997 length:192 start_codon:yes stop_codon:yes gene_type:complete